MKKLFLLLNIILILLTACSKGNRSFLESKIKSDQDIANERLEQLINSINNKNKSQVKSFFSNNIISEITNFETDVNRLINYIEGDLLSYNDWSALNTSVIAENGQKTKFFYSTYDLITSKETYRIAILDCIEDTNDPQNIGFWSLYIIKSVDDTNLEFAYRGDGKYSKGINFNIKNNISS